MDDEPKDEVAKSNILSAIEVAVNLVEASSKVDPVKLPEGYVKSQRDFLEDMKKIRQRIEEKNKK